MNPGENKFGLHIARKIIKCTESEWPELVRGLYRSRKLSTAMYEINNLQRDPQHRQIANIAIRRMGFH